MRLLATVLLLSTALALATPALAFAQDASTRGAPPAVLAAEAEGQPDSAGACSAVPVIGDTVCGAVGEAFSWGLGAVVESSAQAALTAAVGFVVDGAGWLVGRLGSFLDGTTRPALTSGWFQGAYRDMSLIAVLGLLPFLLLALMQGIVRQDVGMLLRSTFAYVPLAAIGTAGAVVVVDLLVELTDQLSLWVGRSIGTDLTAFATGLGTAVAALAVPTGGAVAGFAALLGAAVIAFAAFVIWLELLLRQAAIYVAVLFLPLGFMAMVWPATAHWLRRLLQGLVAIILSKFVIVAVIALAASALDADVAQDGYAVVVSGGALLSLAALAPYVLLRMIPVFEAGMSSQLEGTFRRPTAAVATPVNGGQVTAMMRQRLSQRSASTSPDGSSAPATAAGSGGASGGAMTGAATNGAGRATSGGGAAGGTGNGAAAGAGWAAAGVATAGVAVAGTVARQVSQRSGDGGTAAKAATSSPAQPPTGLTPPDALSPPPATARPSRATSPAHGDDRTHEPDRGEDR